MDGKCCKHCGCLLTTANTYPSNIKCHKYICKDCLRKYKRDNYRQRENSTLLPLPKCDSEDISFKKITGKHRNLNNIIEGFYMKEEDLYVKDEDLPIKFSLSENIPGDKHLDSLFNALVKIKPDVKDENWIAGEIERLEQELALLHALYDFYFGNP